ncbi:MAG TPA: o-succinylbenzoate synthase [Opitutaceae bacterium]|nr:o-succinylbenzoate synthase [Opitutaceae bacterium]
MRFHFQYRRYRLPFRAPVRTAHGVWAERGGVILRVEGEGRGFGYGEAAPIPWFGTESVEEVEAACRELGEWVESEKLAAVPEKLGCLRNAIAAAMSEVGRVSDPHSNTPDLPGPVKDPPYRGVAALLPAGRAALAQIEAKADTGFRVFKWKVGVGDSADELGLLDDLCAKLPSGAKLRLDANGAWDRRRAERWLERCADRPVEFLEQPIAADARGAQDLLLGLAEDYPTPIGLDESLVGEHDVERWLGLGWSGVFVVKPALVADIDAALARLAKAKARVVFSSALETAVGARAALRVALAWTGEPLALGFGVWPLFADARFDGPAAAPFVRAEDVERIQVDAAWNALS